MPPQYISLSPVFYIFILVHIYIFQLESHIAAGTPKCPDWEKIKGYFYSMNLNAIFKSRVALGQSTSWTNC